MLRKDESVPIPPETDYSAIPSLSMELRQKLSRVRPANLAQASRIDGMTPAGLACVLAHIRKPSPKAVA
jgi:tRNA uridine 5-carboxymethylaminomethyl modification enzyme